MNERLVKISLKYKKRGRCLSATQGNFCIHAHSELKREDYGVIALHTQMHFILKQYYPIYLVCFPQIYHGLKVVDADDGWRLDDG